MAQESTQLRAIETTNPIEVMLPIFDRFGGFPNILGMTPTITSASRSVQEQAEYNGSVCAPISYTIVGTINSMSLNSSTITLDSSAPTFTCLQQSYEPHCDKQHIVPAGDIRQWCDAVIPFPIAN